MLEIVSWFVIYFVTHILDCYIFSKLIKEKFRISFKMIILCLVCAIIDSFSGMYSGLIKFVMTNLLTFIILKIIYSESISKTLIGTLFTYIGYVLSEVIFVIIFMTFFNISKKFIFQNYIGILFSNFIIFLIYNLFFIVKKFSILLQKIVMWYGDKKIFSLLSNTLLSVAICYIFIYQISYNNYTNINDLIIYVSFLIVTVIFVAGYFNEKSGNNKLNIEYTQLLEYVKTYEDEVVDKSKKQHEYKNQLIIIDNLISKTNKKAKDYLKKFLNNVEDITDNDWLVKLKNLPSGGIKGLIHFKIKKMIDKKISVFVYVDKELSKKNVWENIDKNLEDISRILGVYLDNAIEAAEKSIDKQIIIEFVNNKEDIEFILSNSYNGNINFDELDKEGYSTKGKGRGVGLSLVKDIIDNNNILKQSKEINGKFFVQKLYIKNKI